ncbi:MAG: alanine racemase [Bacteroidota bacterium]|jgi:alanine racemase|nr:alanine racemase [Bacteroidota bacterium]
MIESIFDDDSIALRPTVIEVDLAALHANVARVRERVGDARIMATVKANAYGHGLLRTARELLRFGVDELGVAFLEEGIALRRAGVTAPILVLGGIIGNQIAHFLEYDLQIPASSLFKLEQIEATAAAMGTRAMVHVKIDTGMGRIGIRHENAWRLFDALQESSHCELRGVFSHFASSHDSDPAYTRLQLDRFLETLEYFPRHGLPMPVRHIANSAAVLQHPDSILDMVRPGIMLYGVYPSPEVQRSVVLRPALRMKTRVVYFKVVREGASIGYDRTWTAVRDTRVVTLPVGYGDGYARSLSNRAQVLIHGKRYPIVGRISMDQCMVDIGQDSAYTGDEVVLIGTQNDGGVTIEELAEFCGTIPYEILTMLSARVPRRYVDVEK